MEREKVDRVMTTGISTIDHKLKDSTCSERKIWPSTLTQIFGMKHDIFVMILKTMGHQN